MATLPSGLSGFAMPEILNAPDGPVIRIKDLLGNAMLLLTSLEATKEPKGSWITSDTILSTLSPALESWTLKYNPIERIKFKKYRSSYSLGGTGKLGDL
tara:strand:- start:721 stop:1017 length:297 start_codon:yes stop_codon:yes gene_type:complete